MVSLSPINEQQWKSYESGSDKFLYKQFIGMDLMEIDAFYTKRLIPGYVRFLVKNNSKKLICSYVEEMYDRLTSNKHKNYYATNVANIKDAISVDDESKLKESLEKLLVSIYQRQLIISD